MTGWVVRQFKGVAPRMTPQLLQDNQGQVAINTKIWGGSLRPLKLNTFVMQLPKTGGPIRSIYRFGKDAPADNQYWFHWLTDVDVVKGPVANDVQERTYWTGDGLPKVADNAIALAGGTNYPMNARTLGMPAPVDAPVAIVGGAGSGLAESRVYAATRVSDWGEESAPSPASNLVNVMPGQNVALTSLPGAPGAGFNATKVRIYRSVQGQSGTPYLFVAEITMAAALAGFTDTRTAIQLGEVIPSITYTMPPAGLKGLTTLTNGVLAGFDGYDIHFSEPYIPHAWPLQYSLTTDYKIVALAAYDSSLLVLTTGQPYVVSGSSPDAYMMVKSEVNQACVSKRSVATINGGVIYASPDGLFLIGGAGVQNLTAPIFTRDEWQALNPEQLQGFVIDNKYIGFTDAGGFMLDPATMDFVMLDWTATAGFYDAQLDELFLITANRDLVKFDTGLARTMRWRSKQFYSARPLSLGAARVEAASYPVTLRVYGNGVLRHTQTVANANAFRLPAGFVCNTWEFEIEGTREVFSAGFAESMQELRRG